MAFGKDSETHSEVFVHDFASFKVRVVEVHNTSGFCPKKQTRLSREDQSRTGDNSGDSRTHSYYLLFVRNLRIPTMFTFSHLLHTLHSGTNSKHRNERQGVKERARKAPYSLLRTSRPCSRIAELVSSSISASSWANIASSSSRSSSDWLRLWA